METAPTTTRSESVLIENLETNNKTLLEKAWEARKHADSHASGFAVGVAIEFEDGTVVTGSNQERGTQASTCAEVVAINKARSQGVTGAIKTIAVVGGPQGESPQSSPTLFSHHICPCGQCRQTIYEEYCRQNKQPIRILSSSGSSVQIKSPEEIIPEAFGPDNLTQTKSTTESTAQDIESRIPHLSEEIKALIKKAIDTKTTSYNPYNQHYQGAAVLTKDGTLYGGNTQSTANYKGSHAARVAINNAASEGKEIKAIAITAENDQDLQAITENLPDLRRQMRRNNSSESIEIFLITPDRIVRHTLESLVRTLFNP